jgi:hypothetical protein
LLALGFAFALRNQLAQRGRVGAGGLQLGGIAGFEVAQLVLQLHRIVKTKA